MTLDAQVIRQLLPTMRYVALDAPREGVHGDWCVRARRIGDASETPMLVRFFQTKVDREGLRPLRLDQTTSEFLFPQQLLTLPGGLVATVRSCLEPMARPTSHQLLQLCRKGERLLAFLRAQDRIHGHLSAANLTAEGQFADAGWAWLTGHGCDDSEELRNCFLGLCGDDELGRELAERLRQGWQKSWSPRLLEAPDVAERVDGPVEVGAAETLCEFAGDVLGVAFSPDSRFLAAVGYEPFIQLVDLVEGKRHGLENRGRQLREVCFSPDGRWLAAREYQGIQLWDLSDYSYRSWDYSSAVRRVAFSLQGDLVVQLDRDVEVLGLPEGRPRLEVEEVQVSAPSDLHPRLRLRAVGEHAGMTNYGGLWADLQLYDFQDRLVWSQGVCRDHVPCLAFSPDGSMLVCGSSGDDSTRAFPVLLWRLSGGPECSPTDG